jgi:hypothetical protein
MNLKLPGVSHGRLGWEDGNIWHLGGVTRWNFQFLIHTWTFLAAISVASQLFLCLFWISLWLKNRCLQHPCFKNLCKIAQASKNSDSNAQHETIWNNLHPFTNPSRLSWKIISWLSDQIFNAITLFSRVKVFLPYRIPMQPPFSKRTCHISIWINGHRHVH